MKINQGDVVYVDVASTNPADPPVVLQWHPGDGKTELTVTLTAPSGEAESHTFHVHSVKGP